MDHSVCVCVRVQRVFPACVVRDTPLVIRGFAEESAAHQWTAVPGVSA